MAQLSSDDFYEILTRLSLDNLLNEARFVCKDWRDLTYNTNFRRLHSTRTQSSSGYYLQSLFKNNYYTNFVSFTSDQLSHSIDFIPSKPSFTIAFDSSKPIFSPPRKLKIEASSRHGLLCCVDSSTDHRIPTYYVVKPTTREWRQIPNPKTKFFTINMGMVVRKINEAGNMKLNYKILRLTYSKTGTLQCEIFDSSIWVWKRLDDVRLPYCVFLKQKPSVLVHGSFQHWLTNEDFIFAFDMNAENWFTIALPEQEEDDVAHKTLVAYEGKLGLLKITEKWLKVWVLEEYFTNRIWKKEHCIDLEADENRSCLHDLDNVYSSEIGLIKDFYSLAWYDLKRDIKTEINVLTRYENAQSYAFDSDAILGSLSR